MRRVAWRTCGGLLARGDRDAQLLEEVALAEPHLAHHLRDAHRALSAHGLVETDEHLELLVAREEGRAGGASQADGARRLVVALAIDLEHGDRLGDALHVYGGHGEHVEAIVDETLRRHADEDLSGRRRALDATRDVDRRAHDVRARAGTAAPPCRP